MYGLADRHTSKPISDDRIGNESLDGIIARHAERIRYIQPMVPRVEGLEEERVHVDAATGIIAKRR